MRRLLAAVGFAVLGLTLVGPGTAGAHALLAGSDPARGALLDKSPPAVVLAFTEAPDLALSSIHVIDASGKSVERGKPTAVAGQRNTVAVAVPSLPRGTYTVTWRTTSADDGHTTTGSFAFGVGVRPSAVASAPRSTPDPLPTALSTVGRWTLYVGLALLLGAAVGALAVRTRVRTRPLVAAWLAAALGLVLLAIDASRTSSVGLGTLVSTTTGHKLEYEALGIAACGLAVIAVGRGPGRRAWGGLGVVAALTMLARARAGHAAASGIQWFTIGTQWVHLLAVGVWVGGLPWLVGALRAAPQGERASVARRFSALATVALAVVIASGTARALDDVGSWHGLFHTRFGVTLLVKLGLVVLVLVFAARSRLQHLPDAGDRLRRSAGAEVAVAAAVLAATAVLAGLTPAKSIAASRPRAAQVVVNGHDFGTTMRVRLVVSPGTPGPNHFVATVTDYDTRQPLAVQALTFRVAPEGRPDIPAASLTLRRAGATWTADSPVVAAFGRWTITAVVQRAAGGTEVPLTFAPRQPLTRITAQRTPGLPTIYTITGASRQVQAYVDPGKRGANEVHFTFLDATGRPLDLELRDMSARGPGKRTTALTFRKLDVGHYVGDAELTTGRWSFTATTTDGLATSFRDTIQ